MCPPTALKCVNCDEVGHYANSRNCPKRKSLQDKMAGKVAPPKVALERVGNSILIGVSYVVSPPLILLIWDPHHRPGVRMKYCVSP